MLHGGWGYLNTTLELRREAESACLVQGHVGDHQSRGVPVQPRLDEHLLEVLSEPRVGVAVRHRHLVRFVLLQVAGQGGAGFLPAPVDPDLREEEKPDRCVLSCVRAGASRCPGFRPAVPALQAAEVPQAVCATFMSNSVLSKSYSEAQSFTGKKAYSEAQSFTRKKLGRRAYGGL